MDQLIAVDANVFWNFACVDRIDLLIDRLGDRLRWTDAVHDELARHVHNVPYLRRILDHEGLPSPLALETDDLAAVARIRAILADPASHPMEHLGEAECIHACETHQGEWKFLTDDLPARDLATKRRLSCMGTLEVLQDCYSMGEVGCPDAWMLMCSMRDIHDRGLRVPPHHSAVCH